MDKKNFIKTVFVALAFCLLAFVTINPVSAENVKDAIIEKYTKNGELYSGKIDNISKKMLFCKDRGFVFSKDVKFFSKSGNEIAKGHFIEGVNVDFVIDSNRKIIMVKKQ